MYVDTDLEIDRSRHSGKYLLSVKKGKKAQRINRALGNPYDCVIQPDEEAIFVVSPTALLVALLAAGKSASWARQFTASL